MSPGRLDSKPVGRGLRRHSAGRGCFADSSCLYSQAAHTRAAKQQGKDKMPKMSRSGSDVGDAIHSLLLHKLRNPSQLWCDCRYVDAKGYMRTSTSM